MNCIIPVLLLLSIGLGACGQENPDPESSTRYYYHDPDRSPAVEATPAVLPTNSTGTPVATTPLKSSLPPLVHHAKEIKYVPAPLAIPKLTSGEADAMLLGILLRSESGSHLDPAAISPRFAVDSTVGPSEEQED
jgi:hypothetical protein